MRIAYYAHLNEGRGSGIVAKVIGQVGAWRAAGHEVRVFVVTADPDASWLPALGDVRVERFNRAPSRLMAVARIVRSIRAFKSDVIYLRWDLFYPPMLFFPRGVPLVAEINTDDLREYPLETPLRARYNRLTRRFLFRLTSGLVFVTKELRDNPAFARSRGRRAVVSNGIDLGSYPSLPAPGDGPRRLVFIGSPGQLWHGVDKVVALARLRPQWCFEVVGMRPTGELPPSNITWHGTLDRSEVLAVLGRADVGLGILALHRKSMHEAGALKVREYLAVGLPVLCANRDPDFEGLDSYTLSIANTETNMVDELDRIDAFVERARGLRVPRPLVEHLDVGQKERQRLAFLAELVYG